jgi:hypothetical protein
MQDPVVGSLRRDDVHVIASVGGMLPEITDLELDDDGAFLDVRSATDPVIER